MEEYMEDSASLRSELTMRTVFLAFFLFSIGQLPRFSIASDDASIESQVLQERLSVPLAGPQSSVESRLISQEVPGTFSQMVPGIALNPAARASKVPAMNQLFISGEASSSQQGRLVQIDGADTVAESNALFSDLGGETEDVDVPSILFDGTQGRVRLPKIRQSEQFRYTNYRSKENTFGIIPEKGDRFGITTLESTAYGDSGYGNNVNLGYAFHFLSGPQQIDLPSRLYQFSMGYQSRGRLAEYLSYDGNVSITVNSDFEGSAREGVFFPGHFAGILHVTPETDWVLGVDYLHRDDIKLLPIAGFSFHSDLMPNVRWDLVFPRPKVQFGLPNGHMFHVAGRLGGGSWDFELPSGVGDVVTYRDYRLLLGFSKGAGKNGIQSIEVGYIFGRKLELRDANNIMNMSDAVAIQFVTLK